MWGKSNDDLIIFDILNHISLMLFSFQKRKRIPQDFIWLTVKKNIYIYICLIVVTCSSLTEHVHRMLCAIICQTYVYNVHNEYMYKQTHIVNSCSNYFLLTYNLKYLVAIGWSQHLEREMLSHKQMPCLSSRAFLYTVSDFHLRALFLFLFCF